MALLTALLLTAGCASSGAFRAGQQAERREDWDRAVLEYSRAVKLAPDKRHFRTSLERARLRGAKAHALNARRLMARAAWKEAGEEFRLALDLSPGSEELRRGLLETEARQKAGTANSLDDLKQRVRERALPGLVLDAAAQQPLGLSFRNASLREVYQALGKSAGVNFVFDPQYQDQVVTLDLADVPFEQALTALGTTGRTFHRVLDSHVVTVVPDTPSKRREYEQQVVKTFFLSNADLKETIDLLRVVLGARRVAPLPGANALTINDSPDKVAAAERIIDMIDKSRAEVVVDVELMEVNRSRLQQYGIELTSAVPNVDGIAGAIFPDRTQRYTLEDNPYDKSNLVISALPGVIYRLLRTDSSTRLLANPQLRSSEGQTAQARFGDQVPVPVTTFAPIAQGGVTQQPITSFEYKNVGVNIDITPRVHHDGDVTLGLKLDVSALGPAGYQGLPTFNSRQVTSTIRLHDGETNVLAGLISDNERRGLSGIPGLASVPVLGRLFARNSTETTETDIVLTLTPHVLRRPQLNEQDLRSFVLGTSEGAGGPLLFEAPSAPALSTPRTEPPRIEPIRPPQPAPSPTPAPGTGPGHN
jgi:general secretion pathway protein D